MFDLLVEKSFKKVRILVKNSSTQILYSGTFKKDLLKDFELKWPSVESGLTPSFGVVPAALEAAIGEEPIQYFMQRKFAISGDQYIIDQAIKKDLLPLRPPSVEITLGFSKRYLTATQYSSYPFSDRAKFEAFDFFDSTAKIINTAFDDLKSEYDAYRQAHQIDQRIEDAIASELKRRRKSG